MLGVERTFLESPHLSGGFLRDSLSEFRVEAGALKAARRKQLHVDFGSICLIVMMTVCCLLGGAQSLPVPDDSRSNAAATFSTATQSSTVNAKTETQSMDRHAGTTPLVENNPRVGFRPTMLFRLAGTRPEPAVSVPSAKLTNPDDTATAEPELDPPGI